MKKEIKVGDTVLAGCNNSRACVRAVGNDSCNVRYYGEDGSLQRKLYNYATSSLTFVSRPVEVGKLYRRYNLDGKWLLVGVEGDWAMVRHESDSPDVYPVVTKVEYLSEPNPKEEALEICQQINSTMSLHVTRSLSKTLEKLIKEM